MRSRYSAFAVGDDAYLLRTWAAAHRPAAVRVVPDQTWTGLTVLLTEDGGLLDDTGIVEFEARYERGGRPGAMHERSTFAREDGRWVYVEGG
jgi:SEC-C motif-containing protein